MRDGTSRYAVRRLALLLPQLLAVSAVTFILIRQLPGDPARAILGPHATAASIETLHRTMGLDRPILTQYWLYLGRVVHGDLGYSWFTSQPVLTDLGRRAPATLELITLSMVVAVTVGLAIGLVSAAKRNRGAVVRGVGVYTRLAGAFPDFWIGLLAVYIFFYRLRIAPAPLGRLSFTVSPPRGITGFYSIDSLVTGNLIAFRDAMAHLALPVLVLGLILAPMVARVTNVSMSESLRSDYVRYARAAGLSRWMVYRYALRNALPQIMTIGGVLFVYLLGGAVLIEKVFSWGGVGQYAVQAVGNSDFAAIQGFVLLAATFTVLVYLVVDLVHKAIDPRVGDLETRER